jgi:hypothetical protein
MIESPNDMTETPFRLASAHFEPDDVFAPCYERDIGRHFFPMKPAWSLTSFEQCLPRQTLTRQASLTAGGERPRRRQSC